MFHGFWCTFYWVEMNGFLLTTALPHEACLKLSRSWPAVVDAFQQLGLADPETFLMQNLGKHRAPTSPVVSAVLNMLNADLWQQ